MKITSVNNDLVRETAKLLKTKFREESGLFLAEGEKCVEEAIKSGLKIKHIFVLEGHNEFAGYDVIETTEAVLSKISDAKSAPKVVAVVEKPISLINDFEHLGRIILLENIKDSGNLGTILRTATAFGIDGIILFGDTVDLYNPKCVRSAVGNLWKIPVIKTNNIEELKTLFIDHEKIATLPHGKNVVELKNYIPSEKYIIMFGSEADGLSDELQKIANKNLTIEMTSNVESLNLSVSVAVVMYKLMV